ncbi:hypothetical protein ACX1HU_03540, partial [Yersinia enterocolitica]
SVTSGHNVTCFDYEVMISPLFRWPNSLCHYRRRERTDIETNGREKNVAKVSGREADLVAFTS